MNFLYVGYYVRQNTFNEILEKNINNMSVARQKFEYNLIRGLHSQLGENIDFISYVPVDKTVSLPEFSEIEDAKITHIPIEKGNVESMINAEKDFKKYLLSLGKEKLQNLCVIMYAVNPIFMLPLLQLKRKYGFKLTTICAEVPAFRRSNDSLPYKIKKKTLSFFNERFDSYILFSGGMREVINCKKKPTLVLEGIAPPLFGEPTCGKKNIVMYAGGLAADNNISLLIDCCRNINELDELWICGVGPEQNLVEQAQKEDKRVRYLGRLVNEEVQELEKQAKLLVNLRSPAVTLTRYSFPSKILEYIASGSMVLSTKLVGIPDEYFDYILSVEKDSKEEITNKIRQCFAMDDTEYVNFCKKSQKFITEEKNYLQQSKKVIDFIKRNR